MYPVFIQMKERKTTFSHSYSCPNIFQNKWLCERCASSVLCLKKKKSCIVYVVLFLIIPNNSCCSFYFANVVFLLLPLLHFTAHPVSMGQTKLLNLEKDGSRSISSLPLTWASLLTAAPHLLSVSRTRLPSGKRPKTNSVPLLTPTTACFGTARPRRPWLPPAIHWTQSTRCDLLV